ncbi:SEC-C domain-containing protein [Bacillus bombysepticus]|uniref:SEC-C domain-containing protein n=1 Tax=Bacillus bombysepticus TaxID=658666 RepID=UPI00301934D4
MTSKNQPCPCGSGKKYKKCCLNDSIVEIKEFNFSKPEFNSMHRHARNLFQKFTYEIIPESEATIPDFPNPKGLRSFCIYRLKQILEELQQPLPNDQLLKAYYGELYWLFYKNIEKLPQMITSIRDLSSTDVFMEFENEGLSDSEQIFLLNNTVGGSLLDFAYQTPGAEMDYGALKLVANFSYQVLSNNLFGNKHVSHTSLYIDTDDTLINWKITEVDYPVNLIEYEIVSMDTLENEYKKLKYRLYGLSDGSLKTLATALAQEDSIVKSTSLLSYTGLAMSYFGVLEQELRNIVYKNSSNLKSKRLMWKDLTNYFDEHQLPILHQFIPDISTSLKRLNSLRNKAAHGEFISYEEFEMLKNFAFRQRALEYISWELHGKVPKIKQLGLIEADVISKDGEAEIDLGSFKKSFEEDLIINADDTLKETKGDLV